MAKRANGEGSYYHLVRQDCNTCKDRNGCTKIGDPLSKCGRRNKQDRWCYQYTAVNADGSKHIKRLYGATKKDLVRRVERMQMEQGDDYKQDITLGGLMDVWQASYLADTVQQSTRTYYRSLLKYVPATLRAKKLTQVTPVMLQAFFTDLLAHGRIKDGSPLSVKTVRGVRTTLGTVFEMAVDNEFITKNPIRKTKPPVSETVREIVYLDADAIKRLLKVADSGEYYAGYPDVLDDPGCMYLIRGFAIAVRLTVVTGVRWGECFGLCWRDVDFKLGTIYIHNNLQGGVLKKPKTRHSIRRISVDADTMRRLKDWKQYQKQYAVAVGDLYDNPQRLLFTATNGVPVRYDNFRQRQWSRMQKVAGLPASCTFHCLRHTHATQLLKKGINSKVISKRLGHSSEAFTLHTYTFVLPEMDQSAADAIASVLEDEDTDVETEE